MRTPVVAVLCALVGGAAGAGIVLAVDDDESGSGGEASRPAARQEPLRNPRSSSTGMTPAEIYKRDSPGVVFIRAQVVQRTQSPFELFPQEQRGESTGTGFVIDREGYILTNAHVVEGAERVDVRFADQKVAQAQVRGRDRSTDLALLRVDPDDATLRPLALGTSRDVEVGDPTVAIGNPFGLDLTLTTGVISAKQRRIEAPNGFQIDDVIQTDAAINPGNSGGPLIDADGEVIGINSQIRTGGADEGSIGIGFAVPIDTAKRFLPQLKEEGSVERAYLGVSTATVDPTMNLRVDKGAIVTDLVPGGPAEDDGLRPGDIIVKIGDEAIATSEDVGAAVDARKPRDRVEVEVVRRGDREKLTIELGRRPDQVQAG
jgi:S1-C subfamily serine protease